MCLVGPGADITSRSTKCSCTKADFECSSGNHRDSYGFCVPDSIEAMEKLRCVRGMYEYTGYQLSRFTNCRGGLSSYKDFGGSCTSKQSTFSLSFFAVLLLLFGVVGSSILLLPEYPVGGRFARYPSSGGSYIGSKLSPLFTFISNVSFTIKSYVRAGFYYICWRIFRINSMISNFLRGKRFYEYLGYDSDEHKYVDIARADDYDDNSRYLWVRQSESSSSSNSE